MKAHYSTVIAALMFTAPLCAQTARERAEKLVAPAMEQIYRCERAQLLDSFSESSREDFRRAWLDRLVALRDFRGSETGLPSVNRIVKLAGFESDFDSVNTMDKRQFWESFLSEQYLRDHEYKAPTAALAAWPKSKVPDYQIEAVSEEGSKLFIVIKASPCYEETILGVWKMGVGHESFVQTAIIMNHPTPERFVWTASKGSDGKEKLDVPDRVISAFTRETAVLKSRTSRKP